jgi:hypothetical protein
MWIVGSAAVAQFRELLIAETQIARILLFDRLQELDRILLTLWRPREHAIKDRFDLFLCHNGKYSAPAAERQRADRQIKEKGRPG